MKLLNDLQNELTVSLLDKCKESLPEVQRIIERTTDDEGMLFEALNLHDELQLVISKYEEMDAAALESGGNSDAGGTSDAEVKSLAKPESLPEPAGGIDPSIVENTNSNSESDKTLSTEKDDKEKLIKGPN